MAAWIRYPAAVGLLADALAVRCTLTSELSACASGGFMFCCGRGCEGTDWLVQLPISVWLGACLLCFRMLCMVSESSTLLITTALPQRHNRLGHC